jgi:hypothetical protein
VNISQLKLRSEKFNDDDDDNLFLEFLKVESTPNPHLTNSKYAMKLLVNPLACRC